MFGLGLGKKKAPDERPPSSPGAQSAPIELVGATFAYVQRGCDAGCDVVQLYRAGNDRLVFGLLDVAGERASNAPLAQSAAEAFLSGAASLFAGEDLNQAEALSNLALQVNRSLMSRGGVRYAAAFLACYEAQNGALWYVNAGHTPALVHDGDFRELGASGVPFGLFSHAIHDAQIAVLPPGSTFLLISKGVVEMRARRRQEFGMEGAKDVLRQNQNSAQELCSAVLDAAEEFARGSRRHDRTAMALVRQ